METNDLEKNLDKLSIPNIPQSDNQRQLKFAIISAKKSAKATLWLMLIPVIVLASGVLQGLMNISIPPWSWMQHYLPFLPVWARFGIFAGVVIIIPLIVVILNVLSVVWLQYDKKHEVLNISIRMRPINIIIIAIAGLIALLFIGHTIADYIAGKG
jgi:hypothetical protein